jgi:L-ascorbate metabolism protein UlaG (beta-lactamase superfamily)
MKIRWAGHAAFVIQAAGQTLITDPFGAGYGYEFIPDPADIVTVSHGHNDHNGVDKVQGKPVVIDTVGRHSVPGIELEGFFSYHDKNQGQERGNNIIFKLVAEGITLVHCGDIGEVIPDATAKQIGPVDVLLIPVGNVYTINGEEAAQVVNKLKPKIVVPMHYSTPTVIIKSQLAKVEAFTQHFDQVGYKQALDLSKAELDAIGGVQVWVLDYQ